MNTIRTEWLSDAIIMHLNGTTDGHCARVDFLERSEAIAVCQYLAQNGGGQDIAFRILATRNTFDRNDSIFITTDQAIEIRNRKTERLCLFIPSDLVDAAYSSLANSFALIDGRKLHAALLKRIMRQLPDVAQKVIRAISRGTLQASYEQRLDFAITALELEHAEELAKLGLELWRVGLIVDASPNFVDNLEANRHRTIDLSRPARINAMTRERIQSLRVDKKTATHLEKFFQGRSMNDVPTWSRELALQQELTFDCWKFPQLDRSTIRSVKIQSFVNTRGEVERYCKLAQPDGANGSLKAASGPKGSMVVRWSSDPPQPDNLSSWSVRIVPSDAEDEPDEESDFIEPKIPRVPSKRRSVTIKLDIEEEELPKVPVCVKVAPLDAAGNEIVDESTGKPLFDLSTEFFLVKDITAPSSALHRESRITVPTIAYGRLEVALSVRENVLEEAKPQWINKDTQDTAYFSLSFPGRGVLNIGLSNLLIELEKQVRDEPRNSGCYTLSVDEIRPVDVTTCVPYMLQTSSREMWSTFWKTREAFFNRLRKLPSRDLVETADWTPELAGAALRYAQGYRELLDTLVSSRCNRDEMLETLSIDSLLVKVAGRGMKQEEALVILPTHPLRIAWLANYTQLLRIWEAKLLELPLRDRKRAIDLRALRLLEPTNVPAFAHHAASTGAFVFSQNLRFFHAVAFPAEVIDPHRRYNDLACIFGLEHDQATMGDIQPDQLKEHLARFRTLHLYTDTLVTTLVNPDRGTFFAEAIQNLLSDVDFLQEGRTASASQESEDGYTVPTFQITAYLQDEHKRPLKALEEVGRYIDQQYVRASDYLLPSLSTTVRPMSQLEKQAPPEAHIAVVTDFTRPGIAYQPISKEPVNVASSNTFYGLITRFISQFSTDEHGLLWQHYIMPESAKKTEHPAGNRYGETLIDLHDAFLDASGYIANLRSDMRPMLEVRLEEQRRDLLERLHTNTNWVITLDRFFTLDYYDSPNQPGLGEVARKYVLDYSPETIEGLGHRMMVTTAWHEEIETLLSRAMRELGFASVDQSVSHLLHYLKTISGRLALQALESSTSAAAAVGLGTVTAWLQKTGRLKQAVLVPVDIYPRLFSLEGSGRAMRGERRCDLILISFKRNLFHATFIEVKWRKGQTPLLQDLAESMVLQMEGSAQAIRSRFFDEERIDGALQRSYLANIVKFYFERSRRYQLFDPGAEATFIEQLTRLEKSGMEYRSSYEGYIVSLESVQRKSLVIDTQTEKAVIKVLTAQDLEDVTWLSPALVPSMQNGNEVTNLAEEAQFVEDLEVTDSQSSPTWRYALKADSSASNGYNGNSLEHSLIEQTQSAHSEVVVLLGEASGTPIEWTPSTEGSPHLFIMGIPGQGKSWTITRILCELGKQDLPSLVLDFHGQFVDPDSSFVRSRHPVVIDAAQGLPFSPFECTREKGVGGWKATSHAVAEIFANVTGMGPMQLDIVRTAIQSAYRANGFEEEVIANPVYPTSEEVLRRIKLEEQSRHVNNVAARCRPLLEMDLFQPTKDVPDLLSSIRSGLVIDLHNLYAEELQLAAGAFVLRKLYRDMFRWGNADRLRLAIILDEAHRLAKDVTLPKIMKEGRKFGIAVVVASQGIGDFHQDILGNAGTKVIFRINYPDSKKVSGFIRGRQGQDISARIEQLSVGSAYVQTPDMLFGSVIQMYSLE
jgi:hypothetical protein